MQGKIDHHCRRNDLLLILYSAAQALQGQLVRVNWSCIHILILCKI